MLLAPRPLAGAARLVRGHRVPALHGRLAAACARRPAPRRAARPSWASAFLLSFAISVIAFMFPSGLGVREGAFALALAQNVPTGVAVALSVGTRLVHDPGRARVHRRRRAGGPAPPVSVAAPRPRAGRALAPRARGAGRPRPRAPQAAVWAHDGRLRRALLVPVDRAPPGVLDRALRPREHGPGGLEHGPGAARSRPPTSLGDQFSRLGAHVDPILVLFAPLAWTWRLPEALLVAQAVIVAAGALPAFWLGRRWLGDDRLAVAAAAVYLLYPPLQWATLTEFHPVTLAAPLLMFCIWAAEERRYVAPGGPARPAALLTKEQVGLALVVLGVWMAVRRHRAAGTAPALAAGSLAWVAIAMLVVIPHFNEGQRHRVRRPLRVARRRTGEASRTRSSRAPGRPCSSRRSYDRLSYLGALLIPLASCSLAAPLLAAGALPELLINVLADWFPQYSIEFQYVAVIVPFLVAAAILGLATAAPRAPARGPRAGSSPTTGRWPPRGWASCSWRAWSRARCRGGTRSRRSARTSAWSSTTSATTRGCWSAPWR